MNISFLNLCRIALLLIPLYTSAWGMDGSPAPSDHNSTVVALERQKLIDLTDNEKRILDEIFDKSSFPHDIAQKVKNEIFQQYTLNRNQSNVLYDIRLRMTQDQFSDLLIETYCQGQPDESLWSRLQFWAELNPGKVALLSAVAGGLACIVVGGMALYCWGPEIVCVLGHTVCQDAAQLPIIQGQLTTMNETLHQVVEKSSDLLDTATELTSTCRMETLSDDAFSNATTILLNLRQALFGG